MGLGTDWEQRQHLMEVLLSNEQTECQIDSSKLESYIENILQTLRCSDKEVSILLVDDKKMRELNKQIGRAHV